MAEKFDNKFEGEEKFSSNKHQQYGKKGRKPRVKFERSSVNLDNVVTNNIAYWNKTAGYNNVTKFLWDLLIGRSRDPKALFGNEATVDTLSDFSMYQLNPAQLCVLRYIPGPGWADSTSNGVNRALARIMSKIRASLSTSNLGFETADLGIFFASTSSITCNIALAKRVLECRKNWKDVNYIYPRALLQAQGFDYADVASGPKAPYYAAKLNSIIDRYNGMNIPDIFDIYDRQYVLAHNIYRDEDTDFGQIYMFTPEVYYLYDDAANPSQAVAHKFSEIRDFEAFLNVIESQIDKWYDSSDLYQINGTLLRAFKDAPLQNIPSYVEGDMVNVEVNREHLMQIMNCTITGDIANYVEGSLTITQNPSAQNYVIWKPMLNENASADDILLAPTQMLRIYENDVSQDDNMEMTRFMQFGEYLDSTRKNIILKDCGSEIITTVQFMTYDTQKDAIVNTNELRSNVIKINTSDATAVGNFMDTVMRMQAFRYLPCVHIIWVDHEAAALKYLGFVGDVYNWMLYKREDFGNLQFQAYQSMWTPKNISLD